VNTTDTENDVGVIAAKWGSSGNRNYWLGKLNDVLLAFYVDDLQTVNTDLSLINDGLWHHVMGVADVSNSLLRIYVDGIQRNTAAYSGSSETGTQELHIGHSPNSIQQEWDGRIDEVRVSNKARGPEWIETEFNNQNDTASFLYVGSEESTSGLGTQSTANFEWVELFNGGEIPINLTGWYLTDNDGNTFNLSGAGIIPVGGYLICHLGESGTNSSTDVYGSITNSESSPLTMLENNDDLALKNNNDAFFDYLVWGADAGSDDNTAVWVGHWTDGEYINTSLLIENQTIGLDAGSNDTNLPQDWENGTGYADPFGIDRSTENGSSPGAQNVDYIIPEYDEILFPIIFMLIFVAVWRKKWIQNKRLHDDERIEEKNATKQDTEIKNENSRTW
jgi:hypothetical protein